MIGLVRRFAINEVKRTLGIGATSCKSTKGSDPRGPQMTQAPKHASPLWFPVTYTPMKAKDPDLARVLRETIKGVRSVDPKAKCVLLGPTLLGWYHTGSQLPWKKEIHILVLSHTPLHAFRTLRARLGECEIEDKSVPELSFRCTHYLSQHTDRTDVRVVLHHHREPIDVTQIKLTVIDDGTGVYVPKDVEEALQKWYGEKNKSSYMKKPPAPTHWVWNAESKEYVRVGSMQRMVHFPMTRANLVIFVVLLASLCFLFVLLVMGIDVVAAVVSPYNGKHVSTKPRKSTSK